MPRTSVPDSGMTSTRSGLAATSDASAVPCFWPAVSVRPTQISNGMSAPSRACGSANSNSTLPDASVFSSALCNFSGVVATSTVAPAAGSPKT
jgi:hypothetical protein